MTGPRPSAEFPAVDPARDLPKAVELLRADAPNRHPYDALLYGMAADVLAATAGDDCGQELAEHERTHHERQLRSWAAPHAHQELTDRLDGPIWLIVWAVREIDRLRALAEEQR